MFAAGDNTICRGQNDVALKKCIEFADRCSEMSLLYGENGWTNFSLPGMSEPITTFAACQVAAVALSSGPLPAAPAATMKLLATKPPNIRKDFRAEVKALADTNKWHAVVALLEPIVKDAARPADHAFAWRNLAVAYRKLDRLGDASSALHQYRELNPEDRMIYYEDGMQWYQRERFAVEIAACLLDTYVQLERRPEAKPWVDRAREKLKELQSCLEVKPKLDTAEVQLERGNFAEAISLTTEALHTDPQNLKLRQRVTDLYDDIASHLYREGRAQEAIAFLKPYLDSHPDEKNTGMWSSLTFAYDDAKQYGEARASCEKWMALEPSAANPYDWHASILRSLGDLAGAIRSREKLIEILTNNPKQRDIPRAKEEQRELEWWRNELAAKKGEVR